MHMQNPIYLGTILEYIRTYARAESYLFRHIQAYSDIFNNFIFLFFTLTLHSFQRNVKEICKDNDNEKDKV